MAAVFQWCEDNGAQTGSPLHGTTRNGFGADTNYPTNVNWKNVDDRATVYSASPITAGNNSFQKYQYGKFVSGFNQISAGLFSAHTAGTSPIGTGLTLKGTVTSTYATPNTTDRSFGTDFSSTVAIGSGLAVSFSPTGPEATSDLATTLSAAGYTQYLATQLITTASAAAGDTASITSTLQYSEN